MKPLIVIVGETASGKSKIALELASHLNGEIINADSWSVYKGFDIGTAKPSDKDRAKVRHYILDVANPVEGFSAVEFKKLATKAMDEIYKRSKIPIIVGGTGLYVDSLIYDYSFLPPSSKSERKYFESLTLNELVKMCQELGYDTDKIDINNKRRVIRLLENKGIYPKSKPLRKNTLILGIKVDPDILEMNIDKRTRGMLKNDLEKEVRSLADKYGWEIEPMKGIGYREFKDFFAGKINEQDLIDRINKNTVKLVKKQKTWFKRNKSIQWLTNRDEFVEVATTFVNKFN
jgi:tRNA dimethylallyltransferase